MKKRSLPEAPGTNKSVMSKRNQPSKRRVKVTPDLKDIGECKMYSDVGGDGRDQYLYDYEELQKVMQMKDATGST